MNAQRIAQAVEQLRERVRRTATAPGQAPKLRDALIGLNADATFASEWNRNKAALAELLDVIDGAYPSDEPLPGEPYSVYLERIRRAECAGGETFDGDPSRVVVGQASV